MRLGTLQDGFSLVKLRGIKVLVARASFPENHSILLGIDGLLKKAFRLLPSLSLSSFSKVSDLRSHFMVKSMRRHW